jgi:hypothetical protein
MRESHRGQVIASRVREVDRSLATSRDRRET